MPLDQDDLLIFSARRKEKPGEAAKPAGEKPQAEPQRPSQPQPQPKVRPQPEVRIPKMEPKPPEVLLKTTFEPTRPFQRPRPAAQRQQPKKAGGAPETPMIELPTAMPSSMNPAAYAQVEEAIRIATGISSAEFGGATVKETKAGERSRMAADGLQCAWHPWRSAYAVCAQCHRPFCFEDITAFGGDYYCLEDIDRAAAVPVVQGGGPAFDKFSSGGAALLIATFFVYIYAANTPLSITFDYIFRMLDSPDPAALISPASYRFLPILGGLALTLICVVSGFLVMLRARKGFILGIASSFLAIAIFMLQFLSTGPVINAMTEYLLVVSIMLGTAAALLAKSLAGAPRETLTRAEASPEQIAWPNTGRF